VRPWALGIGAQKSGTTTIWTVLRGQKWFAAPVAKELNYFSSAFHLGEAWYLTQFPDDEMDRITVDVSPSYLPDTRAAERAWEFDSSLRIFVVLRDPVERAFSAYLHLRRNGTVGRSTTFTDVIHGRVSHRQAKAVVSNGNYYQALRPWIDAFGRDAVHVMLFEELILDPESTCAGLFRHLGIADDRITPVRRADLPHANPARDTWFAPGKRRLIDAARSQSNRGRTRLGRTLRRAARHLDRPVAGSNLPSMSESDRVLLREHYSEQNHELGQLLGRSLPW
jgi:hypothetical protein